MAIQTLNQFDSLPIEILNEIAFTLSSATILVFRATCLRFKNCLDQLHEGPYKIWNKFNPHIFVFNKAWSSKAKELSKAILRCDEANNEYKRISNKEKKYSRKLLRVVSENAPRPIPQVQKNKNQLREAEKKFQEAQISISRAAGEFDKEVKNVLTDMQQSFAQIKKDDWIKLQSCLLFLFKWLQNQIKSKKENTSVFLAQTLSMMHSSTVNSVYSWIVDRFVQSTEQLTKARYDAMTKCVRHNKQLSSDLDQRLVEKHGDQVLNELV